MTRSLAAALLALLVPGPWAAAVEPMGGQLERGLPFLQPFGPKEYGAGASNWAFAQDQRGVVYVGNEDGVLEYDGRRWRLLKTPRRASIRSLAVDPAGRVWAGGDGDLGFLEPDAAGQLRFVSLLPQLPAAARGVELRWEAGSSPWGVLLTARGWRVRVHAGRVEAGPTPSLSGRLLLARGRLFARLPGVGLAEVGGDPPRPLRGGERFVKEGIVGAFSWGGGAGEKTGPILLESYTDGFFLLEGDALRRFPTGADEVLRRDRVYCAAHLADGGVAVGTTQGGICLLDAEGRWVGRVDRAGGLPDDGVRGLGTDRDGGLWAGLNRGIARLEVSSPLTRFDERAGLPGAVLSVRRHLGRLHVATTQGLFRLEPGPEARFRPIRGIGDQTWEILSLGASLLVANHAGVYEVRGDAAVAVNRELHSSALLASRAEPGRLFVGAMDGLASLRRAGTRWVDEGHVAGTEADVRNLVETADGRLWLGTQGSGVFRVTFPAAGHGAAAVERFGIEHGLPDLSYDYVYSLGGEARFATRDGVFRFDEGRRRFEPDPRFSGLFPDGPRRVYALAEDPSGRVWMHTEDDARGVKETGPAVPVPGGSPRWEPGPLRPLAGSGIWDILVDDDGVVWLGGDEGLFRLAPRAAKEPPRSFAALVRRVARPGGGPDLFGGAGAGTAPVLAHADGALRFEYAAPSFDSPDALRFQVFLEGNDAGWSPWSAESTRDYTNLREGSYRFRVRARDPYGVVSEEAVYSFRVHPPWFRMPLAYLAWLLGAAGLVRGLVTWRMRRVEGEKRALEATVAERTAELRAKNEQLETLHRIVRSVNEQRDFDALLETILSGCRVIPGVVRSVALVRLQGTSRFAPRASHGFAAGVLDGFTLELAEAEARYATGALEVSEDVFLSRGLEGRAGGERLPREAIPAALLAVRIRIEGQVEGYLVLENGHDPEAFASHDLELLKGLREHFVSAFGKARSLRLVEEAHEKIADLLRSSAHAGRDVAAWAESTASEVARTIGVDSVAVWVVDGGMLEPMAGTPPGAVALDRDEGEKDLRGQGKTLVPITGGSGSVLGTLAIAARAEPFTPVEERLVVAFAHQLASTLELRNTQRELALASERRGATRAQLLREGVELLALCPTCAGCFPHGQTHCPRDGAILASPPGFLPYRLAGRYRLERRMAEGGMGTVFSARDERLGRPVAVKVIRLGRFADADTRLRFEQEAHAVARIDHPGIVVIHDTGETAGEAAFLVMELLEGRDLEAVVSAQGPGTPRQVALLLRQTGSALGAAHRRNVVHRDVKPENVFLVPKDGSFQAKVLDFGLAKTPAGRKVTQTGMVVGTPRYMSPEQARGGYLDARTDLYSLATVVFYALTGRRTVEAEELVAMLTEVTSGTPPRASSLVSSLPHAVDRCFEAAFEKDPRRRPGDVEAWTQELASLLDGLLPSVRGWDVAGLSGSGPAAARRGDGSTRLIGP